MALRPIVVFSLLTFALVAGCSDGPAKGELVAAGDVPMVEGTAINEYVAAHYPYQNPVDQENFCSFDVLPSEVPTDDCIDPSSNYTFHFMSLPEPTGDGYAVFQVGGTIGEHALVNIIQDATGMWGGKITREKVDESTQFERLELRMGSFIYATASSAAGSQAFVVSSYVTDFTLTGSYKGNELTIDVGGLSEDGKVYGHLYTTGTSGNLTIAESFPLAAGQQTLIAEFGAVADYVAFRVSVDNSKIYLYQATIG